MIYLSKTIIKTIEKTKTKAMASLEKNQNVSFESCFDLDLIPGLIS
jgi:hypothetical protein